MSLTFPLEPFYDRDVSTLKHFPKGVIVFDRDGTLVEDAGQHNKKELLKFLPDAVEAIKILSDIRSHSVWNLETSSSVTFRVGLWK